ncbi:hypothetical protein LTR37_017606 [Vermiconidia calcicola]|uniref:Uncharacterized protein n=1 Tax=Vermiconidia calcicola TaxID=1690605 RepID=A0ACC3MJF9_9PEZI|nr:hypothetical protein LTR37_017606 [Vermiconidia calcicola]
MAESGKQHNTYLPGHKDVKHHELRTAENCAAYLLPTLQMMAEEKPKLTLLDVGAGSGTISTSLARYMPHGQVAGVDLSEDILRSAAQHAEQIGAKNCHFQTGSVYQLPFPDGTFDVVHTHQMLCHLDSPVEALTELLRVTKRGGVVAVRETDMRTWSFWPMLPALERFFKIQLATHEAAGGTNAAGPQLISWALKAGVKRDQVTMTQGSWCYSEPVEKQIWGTSWAQRVRTGEVGKKALAMGLAKKEDLEEMAQAWEEWAQTEDACFACLHGEILVRK